MIGRVKKKISAYLAFGIVNAVLELIIVIYSVCDLLLDSGIMAGIRGYLLLVFVAPIPVILIIIDVIVYLMKRK